MIYFCSAVEGIRIDFLRSGILSRHLGAYTLLIFVIAYFGWVAVLKPQQNKEKLLIAVAAFLTAIIAIPVTGFGGLLLFGVCHAQLF